VWADNQVSLSQTASGEGRAGEKKKPWRARKDATCPSIKYKALEGGGGETERPSKAGNAARAHSSNKKATHGRAVQKNEGRSKKLSGRVGTSKGNKYRKKRKTRKKSGTRSANWQGWKRQGRDRLEKKNSTESPSPGRTENPRLKKVGRSKSKVEGTR